ncbi:YopX family protein [Streptococcus suis]|nr:YopX family protein [Streptococcus suis]
MIPKFRAWDTVKKSMSEAEAIVYVEEKVYPIYSKVIRRYIPFSEAILMQSTGLFDKNGKEIFEGDIIVAMSQGVKAIGEVKRRIDGYWLMYPSWQHGELWHIVENVDTGETGVEIIGNIYENPELVEVLND